MGEQTSNLLIATILPLTDILLNFLAAAIISVLIYMTYLKTHSGTLYSKHFSSSLIIIILVVTFMMAVIQGNPTVSIGLIGALSIVRFRTVIRDSRDIVFLLWSIAAGILCGNSEYWIAAIGNFVICLGLLLSGSIKNYDRFLVIIKFNQEATEMLVNTISAMFEGKELLRFENRAGQENCDEYFYEVSAGMLDKVEMVNKSLEEVLFKIQGVHSVKVIRQEDEIRQ